MPPAAILLGTGWGSNQFSPMLLTYKRELGLSTGTLEAMFGFYALGLIPGLLLAGPLSDVRGRRPVVVPAAALSLVASVVLAAGGNSVALLFLGRLLSGASAGAVFAAGTAWLRESSSDRDAAARRAAVAMTLGFGLGPLVAGLLAQWAPAPTVVPYLPHIALMLIVLPGALLAPETVARQPARVLLRLVPEVRTPRFRRVVAPMAPWVFAAPAISFALLPSVVGAEDAADGIAVAAVITSLTALSGVIVQPLARRMRRPGVVGLVVLGCGLALGAGIAAAQVSWPLVASAIVLGSAYGITLVAGLIEAQRIADPSTLAGLTAAYYALTYLGFAAPYLLALGAHVASYPLLLSLAAALAFLTAAAVSRGG
jgi:MFS family permease